MRRIRRILSRLASQSKRILPGNDEPVGMIESEHFIFGSGAVLKVLDRILGVLLILGGLGHTAGSLQAYKADQMTLLWSLSASLFVFLLAAVNLVRAGRPRDAPLAWLGLIGGLCFIATSLRFGWLIGNVFDFRPLIFILITLGLCTMCVRTLFHRQ